MEFGNLDLYNFIVNYKIGIENILKNKSVKALENEFYVLSELLEIEEVLKLDNLNKESIENYLNDKKVIYLPFVGGFDSYVTCVNGSEFDLDEGLENDWVEGVGYIPSGSRIVDVGEFTISYRNLAGIILMNQNNICNFKIGEYLKGEKVIKEVKNTGLLGMEIKEFIERFNR
ncbi:MAG: hypothetical protein ACRCTZ_03200 [Sarcina sp.]